MLPYIVSGQGPPAGAQSVGVGVSAQSADPGHRLFKSIQVSSYVYNYLGGPGRLVLGG